MAAESAGYNEFSPINRQLSHRVYSPRLLLTLGDVAGIGPEIVARGWPELVKRGLPVVVGDVIHTHSSQ